MARFSVTVLYSQSHLSPMLETKTGVVWNLSANNEVIDILWDLFNWPSKQMFYLYLSQILVKFYWRLDVVWEIFSFHCLRKSQIFSFMPVISQNELFSLWRYVCCKNFCIMMYRSRGGSRGRVQGCAPLPEVRPSSSYSLWKFVFLTGQWRHSLEVHPLLRKILGSDVIP